MLMLVLLAMAKKKKKKREDAWTMGTMECKLNFDIVPARFSKELYRRDWKIDFFDYSFKQMFRDRCSHRSSLRTCS